MGFCKNCKYYYSAEDFSLSVDGEKFMFCNNINVAHSVKTRFTNQPIVTFFCPNSDFGCNEFKDSTLDL